MSALCRGALVACAISAALAQAPNVLTRQEKAAGFVLLFNGKDLSGGTGITPGSFRVLCHHFRRSKPDFFRELKHGPHTQPQKDVSGYSKRRVQSGIIESRDTPN